MIPILQSLKQCLMVTVAVTLLALMPLTTWAHSGGGGGGGGGGGSDSSGGGSIFGGSGGGGPVDTPWSPSQLTKIFSGLTPTQRSSLIQSFSGSTVTKRQLLDVRQIFNVRNSNSANRDAAILDGMVRTLEVLDKAGQLSQDALAFVPGIGFTTSTLLGGARSGANAYRDGKNTKEVLVKTLSGGIAAAIMSKLSKADQALRNVRRASSLAVSAMSKSIKARARALIAKAAAKFLAKKARDVAIEKALGENVEAALNAVVEAKAARNRVSIPAYSPSFGYGMLK